MMKVSRAPRLTTISLTPRCAPFTAPGWLVQPVMMLLDPAAPGGFVRHWTRPVPNVWMHQGYAGQWFGFALIALVLYLRLSLERTSDPEARR